MTQSNEPYKFRLSIFLGLMIIIALNLTISIPNFLINFSIWYSIIYLVVTTISFIIVIIFFTNTVDLKKAYAVIFVLILVLILVFPFIPQFGNIVEVPKLNGTNQSDGLMMLKAHGLGANIVYTNSTDSQRGKIIDQYPDSGIALYKGTKVTLFVGTGTKPLTNILSPQNGLSVDSPTEINGTVVKLADDEKIYVLVKPLPRSQDGLSSDGPYEWYIQPEVVMRNHTWITNIYLGQEGDYDVGRNFSIAVIVTKENIEPNTVYGFDLPQYESIELITLTRS